VDDTHEGLRSCVINLRWKQEDKKIRDLHLTTGLEWLTGLRFMQPKNENLWEVTEHG